MGSGTKVTFEDCTDSSYQHFGGANGHIYFQGSSQVVDAGAWPLSNGLGLYVYDENGNPQQNWEYGDDYHHFYNSDEHNARIWQLCQSGRKSQLQRARPESHPG